MKGIAFILSAYFVFLFAIPCCTFDNCPEENIAQEAGHEKEEDDRGSCSPFFTCTGCSGFTVSFEVTNLEIIPAFSSNQYAGYLLSSIPDVHYDFWQPPKLS